MIYSRLKTKLVGEVLHSHSHPRLSTCDTFNSLSGDQNVDRCLIVSCSYDKGDITLDTAIQPDLQTLLNLFTVILPPRRGRYEGQGAILMQRPTAIPSFTSVYMTTIFSITVHGPATRSIMCITSDGSTTQRMSAYASYSTIFSRPGKVDCERPKMYISPPTCSCLEFWLDFDLHFCLKESRSAP